MRLFLLPVCLTALVLATCAGGGDSSGNPTSRFQPGPVGPSEPGSGFDPIDLNTVVLGGAIFWKDGQGHRATTSCQGVVCTLSARGESTTIDLSGIEPGGAIPNVGATTVQNGVETASFSVSDGGNSSDGFAAWGEYNAGGLIPVRGYATGEVFAVATPFSLGYGPGTNPISGSSIFWRGAMVGNAYTGRALGSSVIGDVTLIVNFWANTIDVEITGIVERQTGRAHADMQWRDLSLRGGAFRAVGIEGRSYGPSHEEMGGVIDNYGIVGAFSTKRR